MSRRDPDAEEFTEAIKSAANLYQHASGQVWYYRDLFLETIAGQNYAMNEAGRYRDALEAIVNDSARPELANPEYLRGIAQGALDRK